MVSLLMGCVFEAEHPDEFSEVLKFFSFSQIHASVILHTCQSHEGSAAVIFINIIMGEQNIYTPVSLALTPVITLVIQTN